MVGSVVASGQGARSGVWVEGCGWVVDWWSVGRLSGRFKGVLVLVPVNGWWFGCGVAGRPDGRDWVG